MAFHFPLMPRMFMALRQEDRHPITEILRQTPDIPENCQWGLFLRNHDELTLEMVTDEERDYMYQAYAADPRMRINVGIRRRLAPLVENSRRRIELLHSLLFSLPGTPVIYYGDEIGMGDNIYLGDRNGVRTPMQWTGDRNAGFSRADPARLYAPPIMDPVYGYQAINVEAQERAPFSLLNWMKRMIALRKQFKVFGRGTLEFLHPPNRKVLAYVRRHEDELVLCVANLSRTVQPVELDLSAFTGMTPVEMLGLTEFPRIGELPYFLTLPRLLLLLVPAAAGAGAGHGAARARDRRAPVETRCRRSSWASPGTRCSTATSARSSSASRSSRSCSASAGSAARRARCARRASSTGALLRSGTRPDLHHDRRGRLRGRRPRAVSPAAGDRRRARRPDAMLAAYAAGRRSPASPARARASSSTPAADEPRGAGAARGARRSERSCATKRGVVRAAAHRRRSPSCAATGPLAPQRGCRRAEQHVDRLRRSADPQAVPPRRAAARIPTSRSAST